MSYRVFIPTAGLGSRLKGLSRYVNKALVTLADKPVISHIIEKFSPDIEIVVALGYKADSVREFLTLAYPERTFLFRQVSIYEGEGSGLGLTLLECQDLLQCPFIFCSNDTLVTDDIPAPESNWMGFYNAPDNSQYRSLRIYSGKVEEICAKGAEGDVKTYIGLAGIHDFNQFWQAMSDGRTTGAIEIGESYGLRQLLSQGVLPIEFDWHDTGNVAALESARKKIKAKVEANVLEKEQEAIWFVNNKVIKFSIDHKFIRDRVLRAQTLQGFVPKITASTDNMYVYDLIDGEVLSKHPTADKFANLLGWLEGFWLPCDLDASQQAEFNQQCLAFYRDKTFERVKQYFLRFEQIDQAEVINDQPMPTVQAMLEKVDWESLSQGSASRFHGDLHFENILMTYSDDKSFSLIDWRQNFAGNMVFGDIYYDFAKLNHGLIMCHELVDKDLFDIRQNGKLVHMDFLRKHSLVKCEKLFETWLINNGYDYKKVKLLTALIFLNIAALHHYPYSLLLFYLGKQMLHEHLNDD
ncbi:phosphotransferase [uncultured Paraglaciecola sp.]|uniref:phosphotransferase n=1 Tax=uncultured Paraglaciecola sp. TaxID=1765024 RepID=UPI0025FF5F77|nr:phosphotransferase [uncultured Paraglaciecola sp.]